MNIRPAVSDDFPALARLDRHIPPQALEASLRLGRISIAEIHGALAGWLRWGLFWDSIPFLNLLFVLDGHRGQGLGRALMEHWEAQMRQSGYPALLTSTQSNELAQHFYYRMGYAAVGGFLPPNEPYELILAKKL